jgi:hypothetical protein
LARAADFLAFGPQKNLNDKTTISEIRSKAHDHSTEHDLLQELAQWHQARKPMS